MRMRSIPTLAEVYELLKPIGLEINVEIKTGIYFYPGIEEKLFRLEQALGMQGKIYLFLLQSLQCDEDERV